MSNPSIRRLCLQAGAVLLASVWLVRIGHSQQSVGGVYSLGITDEASVGFVWNANSEPDVVGYRLYVGTVPGLYTGFVEVGNATQYRLTGLVRGMTYYFSLTAYNTAGLESGFADELSYQVPLLDDGGLLLVDNGYTNQPPYFEPLPDIVLEEGTTNYFVLLLGIHAGAAGERDTLTVTATSSSTNLVPTPRVNYVSPEPTALLTLNPVPRAVGTGTITATVQDDQAQNNNFSRTFSVTVEPVNSPPVISLIPPQQVSKNQPSAPIPFTVSDSESPPAALQVTVGSSNPEVLPTAGLILEGSDDSRMLIIDPTNGRTGISIVTLSVSDGTATSSVSFQLTIGDLAIEDIFDGTALL
jgi:hypothetical protein